MRSISSSFILNTYFCSQYLRRIKIYFLGYDDFPNTRKIKSIRIYYAHFFAINIVRNSDHIPPPLYFRSDT